MISMDRLPPNVRDTLVRPGTGTLMTILSGLSFLMIGMFLPLVGKAGYQTEHYTINALAFVLLLLLSGILSGLALISKLERRKMDGSPYPRASLALATLNVILLITFALGLLHI